MSTIYNFKISENLYKDLQSQATWRHHKLKEEMRLRLERTCVPSYGYNYSSDLTQRIRDNAYKLYTDPEIKPQMTFDLYISKKMNKSIEIIRSKSKFDKSLQSDELKKEIVNRLAYTLIDPFYDKFEQ